MDEILNHFESILDFEEVLFRADDRADNPVDGDFVDEILDRYDDYGEHMYLSAAQADALRKLSESSHE